MAGLLTFPFTIAFPFYTVEQWHEVDCKFDELGITVAGTVPDYQPS